MHSHQPVQHVFTPYAKNGKLTAPVSGTAQGTCWTLSIAVTAAGVYRCIANNQILDPCFAPAAPATPPTVTCFADPWTAGMTLVLSAGGLPKNDLLVNNTSPWALELANGAHCVVVTGALPLLDGYVLQYRCGTDAVASMQTARDGSVRAMYGLAVGPLRPVAILAMWRGRSY